MRNSRMNRFNSRLFLFFLLFPFFIKAQNKDSLPGNSGDSLLKIKIRNPPISNLKTIISGKVLDQKTGTPLAFATVSIVGTSIGTNTLDNGSFQLEFTGPLGNLKVELVGYKELMVPIEPGKTQDLSLKLQATTQVLKGLTVKTGKKKKYRNRDNPAVSLIQEIINHKEQNRMQSQDYLQFHQYERIEFSLFNLSNRFLNSKAFRKYRFLLDTTKIIDDEKRTTLPVYLGEKKYENYQRREPEKAIKILKGHREVNFSTFIDTAGLDIYLNRLYNTADIYENNIFILTNQFLSPISDHSPNYYKYFITDTVQNGMEKLLEVSFIPRNQQDLLFEGKLFVTTDGSYAVKSVDLNIGHRLNLNFVRSLRIHQDFEKHPDGHYYLEKSKIQSDFGLLKSQGFGLMGERNVYFRSYKSHIALADSFYNGATLQISKGANIPDPSYWDKERLDSLPKAVANTYHNLDSLQSLSSFKKLVGITTFITGGYGVVGPIQIKPLDATFAFNSLEGSRITLGGRSTPAISKTFYFEDYIAYGFKDQRFKFYTGVAYSFNKVPPYKYPQNFLRASYVSETDIPGQNFLIEKTQSLLRSFSRGTSNLWQYNQFLTLDYQKEWLNHMSLSASLKVGAIQPAKDLVFTLQKFPLDTIQNLHVGELSLGFRYAPNEQIFQGSNRRRSIPSKYPIFTLRLQYGIKGLYQNPYSYLNTSSSIYKRFYFSQLGYSDITLRGGFILGQVPFPLMDIVPANQTYIFDKAEFNTLNFLEFITDHYIGIDISQHFGGFFLNKIPVLQKLHLREIVGLKIIQGGISDRNGPDRNPNFYKFPVNPLGNPISFALGNEPFMEGSIGIGNILKVFRMDLVERFSYLDHPDVYRFGFRFSFTPDL